jgi:hypothetical protein
MKRRDWLLLALLSSGAGARGARPRYGGTLRVFPSLPAANLEPFSMLVTATQFDANRRVWRFSLRPNVMLQGSAAWTATLAAERIKAALPAAGVSTAGNVVVVTVDQPQPDLPTLLDQRVMIESGPFEPVLPQGPKPTMRAYESYWSGRPYLDAIELAGSPQDADLVELNVAAMRRPRLENHRLWSTAPIELVAVDGSNAPAPVRQALTYAVDRASILKVLLQGRGEAAGGLAPQWLSGYAFAFPTQTDLTKARAILAGRSQILNLSYPAGDTLLRLIAERIAVNARDIGLPIQPKPVPGAELRMLREPVRDWPGYDLERAAMEDRKLIPVVHVPHLYSIHARVKGWDDAHDGKSAALHLEAIWVEE